MNSILKQWDFLRVIRLAAGVGLGIYAIVSKEYPFLFLSAFFLVQAILNISCCGSNGCSSRQNQGQLYKDIIKPYKPERKK